MNNKPKAHEIIVQQIIDGLEKGIIPWKKTWITRWQKNLISKENYRWFNQMLLSYIAWENSFSEYWLTYKQIKTKEWKLKEWAIPVRICYYTTFKTGKVKKINWKEVEEEVPALRYYIVYNLSEVEWIEIPDKWEIIEPNYQEKEIISEVDKYIEQENIRLCINNWEKASYSPMEDKINVPDISNFINPKYYIETLLHETIHSTGAEHRLDRKLEKTLWKEEYSREELVAEIGSAILCNEYGVDINKENTQAYINSWIRFLKDKPKEIITASNRAFKAVEFYFSKIK